MILVVFVGLAAAAVPLAKGRLMKLADLKIRMPLLVVAAIGIQLYITVDFSGPRTGMVDVLHVASYVIAAAFVWVNRKIPGMWLIGVGAALNVAAIAANGGVMPATPHALAVAGLPVDIAHFKNSMAIVSPKLSFLGDVFAVPKSIPFSNVFSIGDICIALGAAFSIHRVTGSRLVPSGQGQFSPLLRERRFMRLWSAQAVSNIGDWTYALAVAVMLVRRTHSPQLFALLLVAQVGPAAIFGGLLGGLGDRYSRS